MEESKERVCNDGWIKLHRSLLDWEWWDDMNVTRLWIYILLRVNHEDKKWRGKTIEKGSMVTSFAKLAAATGLTVDEVRTVLGKLERTRNITRKSTNKYQLVTVEKWGLYQIEPEKIPSKSQANPKQPPNKSQPIPNLFPTNKNEKNERNKELYLYIVEQLNQKAGTKYRAASRKTQECINARLAEGFSKQDFITVIDKKCAEWGSDPKMCKYLRPETLFGPKFEGYLNQKTEVRAPGRCGTEREVPDDGFTNIKTIDFAQMERKSLEERLKRG